MGDDRPAVYLEDGVAVYRASSLGMCTDALLAARLGMTPAEPWANIRAGMDRGTAHEFDVIEQFYAMYPHQEYTPREQMVKYGTIAEDGQLEVEFAVGPRARVRGHLDGMTEHGVFRYVLEAKFLSEDTWKRVTKKPLKDATDELARKYAWQLSAMMCATGLPAVFVCAFTPHDAAGNPKLTEGNGGSGRELLALHTEWVKEPPVARAELMKRVLLVERWAREGKEPQCDGVGSGWCPYHYLHGERDVMELDPGDDHAWALLQLATQYGHWQKAEKDAFRERKLVGTAIEKWFAEHGQRDSEDKLVPVVVGDWKVVWVMAEQPEKQVKAYTMSYPKVSGPGQ